MPVSCTHVHARPMSRAADKLVLGPRVGAGHLVQQQVKPLPPLTPLEPPLDRAAACLPAPFGPLSARQGEAAPLEPQGLGEIDFQRIGIHPLGAGAASPTPG